MSETQANEDIAKEGFKAVEALREKIEQYGEASHEAKQLAENAEKAIEEMDQKNDELVGQMALEKKAREELEENVKDLELSLARANTESKTDYKETPEYKALENYAKVGKEGMSDEERKQLLRQDDPTSGGYLTDTEMDDMIIRQITEISPVRQVARVKTVGKKTLEIPTRTGIPTAAYEGEAAPSQDSTSTYGSESLTTYRQSVTVPFTADVMMDSAFDLEAEIMQDVSEAYAFGEGNAFVLGTGAKMPEGFLTDSRLTSTASTTNASGVLSADDLITLTGQLKFGYNPMYAFNRRTLANIRTFKGSDGQYLWQSGLGGGAPNTIAGDPYMRFEDMPDIAANALAVVYADFMRGYNITDRTGMTMIRNIYSSDRENIIRLTFHRYNTGQVVLPEAFKLLRIQS